MEGEPGEVEGRDARRLVALARLAGRLRESVHGRDVIDAVVAETADAVGMEFVSVSFVRGDALVSDKVRWPVDEDLIERYATTPLSLHVPSAEAVRTVRTVVVPDLREYQAGHPELLADVATSGLRSAAYVPFLDAKGEVLGVLELVSRHAVDFDEATVAAVEVAGTLCGNALRRSQLGERASALALLAARLAGAVTTVDVAEALRELGREPLGAVHVNCRVLDASGSALVSLVDSTLPGGMVARYERVPLAAELPLSRAARTGEGVWVGDAAELAERFPDVAADAEAAGFAALAAAPVHDSRGRVLGALALAWSNPIRFDPLLRSSIITIADLGGLAIERTSRYDTEHELVASFRNRLLGVLEPPATVDVATRYLPAATAVGIGGDWFDLVPTGPTSFTLVIGDVTGHGVEAVATMAQLRAQVLGLVRSGEPVDTLFDRVEAMRDVDEKFLASVAVYAVDTGAAELRYAGAGHPWGLLRRSDGSVEVLDRAQRALLGAPSRTYEPAVVPLRAGDVLVAYTDGLVERRNEPITAGLARLVDQLAAGPADDAEALADALLAATFQPSEGALDDDLALVVLRLP